MANDRRIGQDLLRSNKAENDKVWNLMAAERFDQAVP